MNKEKFYVAVAAVLLAGSTFASSKMHLDGDQVSQLSQVLLNVVTFLVGLFINPKKRNN